jgi:predicted enzyme related to lactoylglutathione lyase
VQASLERIILYVHDVEKLATFYSDAFDLSVVEEIKGEWAVLKAGTCELALHRVGKAYRDTEGGNHSGSNNVKLVFTVDRALTTLREELIAKGVPMRAIKSFPPLTGLLCDGEDPEGNVFQLSERVGIA